MAWAASAPEYAALANEVVAEAHRSPKLLAMLRANDAALTLAIRDKLDAQQRAGAVSGLDDSASLAQALMILFDGLTIRQFMLPKTSKALNARYLRRSVSALLVVE